MENMIETGARILDATTQIIRETNLNGNKHSGQVISTQNVSTKNDYLGFHLGVLKEKQRRGKIKGEQIPQKENS